MEEDSRKVNMDLHTYFSPVGGGRGGGGGGNDGDLTKMLFVF